VPLSRVYAADMKHIHLDEIESLPALGGELRWKPVRHALAIGAFGINEYTAEAAGELVVEEHEDDHQELYVVVAGAARFRCGAEELDAPAGTLVLLQPGEHRVAHALEPGTTVLAIGAEDARFIPSAWEASFRANGLVDLGRPEEARFALAEGTAHHPDMGYHFTRARIAAAEGKTEEARAELGRAIAEHPSARERAAADPLLRGLL
jgi:mannose-6-phosphate isomerase-like protein (cupin superfamily)